jgi:hypothetical protein
MAKPILNRNAEKLLGPLFQLDEGLPCPVGTNLLLAFAEARPADFAFLTPRDPSIFGTLHSPVFQSGINSQNITVPASYAMREFAQVSTATDDPIHHWVPERSFTSIWTHFMHRWNSAMIPHYEQCAQSFSSTLDAIEPAAISKGCCPGITNSYFGSSCLFRLPVIHRPHPPERCNVI